MATERINIVVSSKGTVTVKKEMREIGQEARKSADGVDLLKGALTGWLSGNALSMLTRYADTFTNIQNRLKLVTKNSDELTAAQERLYQISQSTYQGFEDTVQVFQRTAAATQQLGYSTEDALAFTEQLSQAVALSGVSAESASAALIQLSQGLASGTLRGQELNSMLEQLPYASQALATGLGVTVGQLRALAEQGQLTPQQIIEAFNKMKDNIAADMAQMTPTISQGLQTIENGFIKLLGVMEKNTGVFGLVGRGLALLGNNMEMVAIAASPLIAALTVLAGRILGGMMISATVAAIAALKSFIAAIATTSIAVGTTFVSAIMSAITAIGAFTIALATNPLTWWIAGVTVAVAGLAAGILALTGYLDEVWAYIQEWAAKIAEKFVWLSDLIKKLFGEFSNGKISLDVQAKGLKEAADALTKGLPTAMEDGGKKASDKLKEGMDKGGDIAKQKIEQGFEKGSAGIQAAADVLAAKFGATGRNIYDLWSEWGDAFINNFETTIGEMLVDYQQAMTKNIEAQTELLKEQTRQLKQGDSGSGSGSGSGGKSSFGGSFGSRDPIGGGSWGKHEQLGLNRYANGGQFMVGGQGGTDSQKVEFMATPNERVTVETPAQQRTHDKALSGGQSSAPPVVNIVNQIDPRSQVDVMGSRAGRETTYNTIAADPERVRRLLGV